MLKLAPVETHITFHHRHSRRIGPHGLGASTTSFRITHVQHVGVMSSPPALGSRLMPIVVDADDDSNAVIDCDDDDDGCNTDGAPPNTQTTEEPDREDSVASFDGMSLQWEDAGWHHERDMPTTDQVDIRSGNDAPWVAYIAALNRKIEEQCVIADGTCESQTHDSQQVKENQDEYDKVCLFIRILRGNLAHAEEVLFMTQVTREFDARCRANDLARNPLTNAQVAQQVLEASILSLQL